MNNEKYNQIISEVYGKYLDYLQENEIHGIWYDLEIFINECKTDTEFSERWGLKIEEKELSFDERSGLAPADVFSWTQFTVSNLDELKVPTKLIMVSYNNETIEIYE